MVKYLTKRFLRSFLTLFIIITVVFVLLRQMPEEGYFPSNYDKLSESQKQSKLKQLGLDRPIYEQLFNFYKNLFKGDLGTSWLYRREVPVTDVLAEKAPVSLTLGSVSLLISLLLGLPLGTLMAQKKNGIADQLGTAYIVFIQAVPAAVYYLFIQLFGTTLLDVRMTYTQYLDVVPPLRFWILPVFSMALDNIAGYAMWLRRYMVDQSTRDYVQLAKIKGVSSSGIMFKHIFRNAFVPMVQYLPESFLNTVIGSIYIETLYSIPGMGGLLVQVVKGHDNPLAQAIVMLFASVGVLGLILGDILMVILDPRITFAKKEGSR